MINKTFILAIALIIIYVIWQNVRFKKSVHTSATNIIDTLTKTYTEEHVKSVVQGEDFTWLDLQFYHLKTEEFVKLGFRRMADIEDVTQSEAFPHTRTFIRALLNNYQGINCLAYIYDCTPKSGTPQYQSLKSPNACKIVEVETELSDASYIITSTANLARFIETPAKLIREFVEQDTAVKDIFELHIKRVREYLAQNSTTKPLAMNSLEDILATQGRQQLLKSLHRQGLDHLLTDKEMFNLSKDGLEFTGKIVLDEMKRIKKEKK